MRIHLTRAATVGPFCDFLAAGGSSYLPYLEAAGLAAESIRSPEAPLPLQQGCWLVENMARRNGINDIGLAVGSSTSVAKMGLFGKALSQSLTLKDLLGKMARLVPMVNTGAHAWTENVPGSTDLRLCVSMETDTRRTQIEAYSLLLLLDGVRLALGRNWRPRSIWINEAEINSVSRCEPFSEAKVHTVQGYAAFVIPKKALAEAVRRGDTRSARRGEVEAAFLKKAPLIDFVGSLMAAIQAGIGSHTFSVEGAAELIGSSTRTLQRRLESEGLTYRQLLDRVRFQRSQQLLAEPRLSLSEIARELGYGEEWNFTHAFRRWTGLSPLRYRRMHG